MCTTLPLQLPHIYQYATLGLPVGQRLIPDISVCAVDRRPIEIQDLLPSDTRFKILVFTGDTSEPEQLLKVVNLAEDLEDTNLSQPTRWLRVDQKYQGHHGRKPPWYVFLLLLLKEIILARLHAIDILDSSPLQPGGIDRNIGFPPHIPSRKMCSPLSEA